MSKLEEHKNVIIGGLIGVVFLIVAIAIAVIFSSQPEPKVVHKDIPIVMDVEAAEGVGSAVMKTASDIRAEEEERRKAEEEARQKAEQKKQQEQKSTRSYSGNSFKSDGVWYDDNYRYTWYSSNVLYHYRTPEWTAGSDGIYRDANGYVVVASSDHPQGTVIESTPFGAAKVYDSGCASGTLDVYTNF